MIIKILIVRMKGLLSLHARKPTAALVVSQI